MPVKVVAVVAADKETPVLPFVAGSGKCRRTSAASLAYPMMVMRLDRALALKKLEPHQEYRRRGDIVEFKDGMKAIFLSHEWLARAHPDPDMEQFSVFQQTFGANGLVAGNPKSVDPHWLDAFCETAERPLKHKYWAELLADPTDIYIWYDFISVPQKVGTDSSWAEQQKAAINSIPAYVDRSMMFVALVPSLDHLVKSNRTVELVRSGFGFQCFFLRLTK
jgi:hypothetical protein